MPHKTRQCSASIKGHIAAHSGTLRAIPQHSMMQTQHTPYQLSPSRAKPAHIMENPRLSLVRAIPSNRATRKWQPIMRKNPRQLKVRKPPLSHMQHNSRSRWHFSPAARVLGNYYYYQRQLLVLPQVQLKAKHNLIKQLRHSCHQQVYYSLCCNLSSEVEHSWPAITTPLLCILLAWQHSA